MTVQTKFDKKEVMMNCDNHMDKCNFVKVQQIVTSFPVPP